MMTRSIVAPLVVLLAGGVWISGQFRSISDLEDQNSSLQDQMAMARDPGKDATRITPPRTALDDDPVDWTTVATQFELTGNLRGRYLSSTAPLVERFDSMTREELLAALGGIVAGDLSEDHREILEQLICARLVNSEDGTRLVLDHFAGHHKGKRVYRLATYFANWLDRKPEEALTWLEQHGGELDSPTQLVSQSFYPRLLSDPGTASRILTAMPESKRLGALSVMKVGSLSEDQQVAWVHLIRAHVPEQDQARAVTWPTQNWSDGDGSRMSLTEVDAYLERIQATPSEREACVLSAMEDGAVTASVRRQPPLPPDERIEALRDWVTVQAPSLLDRATGRGLLGLVDHGASYAEVAEIALRYHEESRNDEVLLPLLERSSGDESRPAARLMAARLLDDELRRKYQQKHP